MPRSAVERRIKAGFVLALACLAAVGIASYSSVRQLRLNSGWVEHTHQVLARLELLVSLTTDAETAERGYVITADADYLQPFASAERRIGEVEQELAELTVDNPQQQQRLRQLKELIAARLAAMHAVLEAQGSAGFAAAQRLVQTGAGKRIHSELRDSIDAIAGVERSLLQERQRQADRSTLLTVATSLGAALLAFACVGWAAIITLWELARRRAAERALHEANSALERRVRERAALLAGIVESTDDAIITETLDGTITSWNPGAARLFGSDPQHAIGHSIHVFTPQERFAEQPALTARIARGEGLEHFETVALRSDGTRIDVAATVSPLRDGTGQITGACKIVRDISERKAQERRLQRQLERLHLLQHITRAIGERQDLHSIFQVTIRSLEEHLPIDFGCIALYEPTSQILEVSCVGAKSRTLALELALPEHARIGVDQNGLLRCIQGELVYEPDIAALAFPFPARVARGGLRSLVMVPLRVETRVLAVMIAARREAASFSSTDCEFLKQLGEHLALAVQQVQLHSSLRQAYDDLRQTQQAVMQQERLRALVQMTSGVAHDINNTLSPAALYSDMLLERGPSLPEEVRDYLLIIRRVIENAARTVTRMREASRPRDPDGTLSAVNLNVLLQQVAEHTRARWSDMPQEHGFVIELKMELDAELPLVMGAESEIRDALTNLVLNAVDAMPHGGTLTLRSKAAERERAGPVAAPKLRQVAVEVADTGEGMTEAVRNRCLEPFFTTKGEQGTGLGLAMVYGMAQRHGADLEIDSEPGVGTTVGLTFTALTTAEAPQVEAALQPQRPLRILLVDDDALVLRSLRDTLEADGHSVTSEDGGQKGIEAFFAACEAGKPYDIVITDLGMPNVDGRTVAAAIKSAVAAPPVILLTGWGRRSRSDQALPDHVDALLSKPAQLAELRATLASLS